MHIVDTRDWSWVQVCADLSSLPQRLELSYGSRRGAIVLILFGASWVIIPLTITFQDPNRSWPALALLAAFAVIGAGLAYGGFAGLYRREWAVLGHDGVEHHYVSLRRSTSWSEPFSAYKGVRYRKESVRRNNRHIDFQIIELLHDDREKCIPLFVSRSREVPRAKLESYARALNLPALEFEGRSLSVREQGDLDKPLAELVAEGKVASEFDSDEAPPEGLSVTRDSPDSFTIGFTVHRKPVSYYVTGLAIGLLMIAAGSFIGGIVHISTGFGLILCWVSIGGLYRDRTTRRALRVDRGQVSVNDPLRSKRRQLSTLSFDEIESIFVDDSKGYADEPVVIVSDGGRMSVGGGLSPEATRWLRDFLIAAVATA